MRKNLIILSIYLVTLPFSTAAAFAEKVPLLRTITFPSGKEVHAEVADTPATREKGLMFRDHLAEDSGMLFIFQQAAPHQFWMKNCKFPIDIIWLNEKKEVLHLSEKTPPCKADPCPLYGPITGKAVYVIEVISGMAQKEKLKPGMKIQF